MIDTDTLAQIEELERRAIKMLSGPMRPNSRDYLKKRLAALKAAKQRAIASGDILRKSSAEPADDNTAPTRVFHNPHMSGMLLHAGDRQFRVGINGHVEIRAGDREAAAMLRGRHFRELTQVDRFGKTANGGDVSEMFARDRLRPIAPPFDFRPKPAGQ